MWMVSSRWVRPEEQGEKNCLQYLWFLDWLPTGGGWQVHKGKERKERAPTGPLWSGAKQYHWLEAFSLDGFVVMGNRCVHITCGHGGGMKICVYVHWRQLDSQPTELQRHQDTFQQ